MMVDEHFYDFLSSDGHFNNISRLENLKVFKVHAFTINPVLLACCASFIILYANTLVALCFYFFKHQPTSEAPTQKDLRACDKLDRKDRLKRSTVQPHLNLPSTATTAHSRTNDGLSTTIKVVGSGTVQ